MKLFEKIIMAAFAMAALFEYSWYARLEQKKVELERSHNLECTHIKNTIEPEFTLPVLKQDVIPEILTHWMLQETKKLFAFRLKFVEYGSKKSDTKYLFNEREVENMYEILKNDPELTKAHYLPTKLVQPNFDTPSGIIIFCGINHDTGYYSLLIADITGKNEQKFVWTANGINAAQNTVPQKVEQLLGSIPYIRDTVICTLAVISEKWNKNMNDLWNSFFTFVLTQTAEKKHDVAHKQYQQSYFELGIKQQAYKTRLLWYGFLFLLFILVSKGKRMTQFLKSLTSKLLVNPFKRDPAKSKLKDELKQLRMETSKLAKDYQKKLKEAKKEAKQKLIALEKNLRQKKSKPSTEITSDCINDFFSTLTDLEKRNLMTELAQNCQLPNNENQALEVDPVQVVIQKSLEAITLLEQGQLTKAQRGSLNSLKSRLNNLSSPEEFLQKQVNIFKKTLEKLEREFEKNALITQIDSLSQEGYDKKFLNRLQVLKAKVAVNGASNKIREEFVRLENEIRKHNKVTV